MLPEPVIVLVGLGVFAAGLGAGIALRARGGRQARERELEEELSREREAFQTYRERVRSHMDQAAHLFRDLTNQHAALYQHLAQAAHELSPTPDQIGGQAFGRALIEFASDAPALTEAEAEERPKPAVEPPPAP